MPPSRRAKWDVGAENGAKPQKESEEELKRKAREAAARIAAQTQATDIFEDVPINDLGPTMRAALIRRSFLANVERQTGSTLMLRGRHYGPGASMLPGQPPLHIHISTSAMHGQDASVRKAAVAQAATHIRGVAAGTIDVNAPVAKAPINLPAGARAPPPDTLNKPSTTNTPPASAPAMPQNAPTMFMPPGMHPQYFPGAFPAPFPGQQLHPGMPFPANMYPPFMLQGGQVMAAPFPGTPTAGPQVIAGQPNAALMPSPYQSAASGQPPNAISLPAAPQLYQQQRPATQGAAPAAAEQPAPAAAPAAAALPAQTLVQPPPAGPEPQSSVLQVDIDPPEGYSLVDNLRGPGGSYLQHIENATNATVQLRGKGVGGKHESDSPLSIWLFHPEPWKRSAAYDLAKSLIETVRSAALSFVALKAMTAAGEPVPNATGEAEAEAGAAAAGGEEAVAGGSKQQVDATHAAYAVYEQGNGQIAASQGAVQGQEQQYSSYYSTEQPPLLQQQQQQKSPEQSPAQQQQAAADPGYAAQSARDEQATGQQAASQGQYSYPSPSGGQHVFAPSGQAQAYPERPAGGYQGYPHAMPQQQEPCRAISQQWQQVPSGPPANVQHTQQPGAPGMPPPVPQGQQPDMHPVMKAPDQQNWTGRNVAPASRPYGQQWALHGGGVGHQQAYPNGAYMHAGVQPGPYPPLPRGPPYSQQNVSQNAPYDGALAQDAAQKEGERPPSQAEQKRKFREFKESVDKPPPKAPILPTYYSHLAREEPSKKRASNAAQAPSTTPDPAKAVPAQQPHAGPQYGAPQPKYAWNESAGPVQMVQQPHPHQYGPHLPPQPVARPNGFPMARPPSGPPFSGQLVAYRDETSS